MQDRRFSYFLPYYPVHIVYPGALYRLPDSFLSERGIGKVKDIIGPAVKLHLGNIYIQRFVAQGYYPYHVSNAVPDKRPTVEVSTDNLIILPRLHFVQQNGGWLVGGVFL
ncbi:hypothetical protein ES703_112006 [subsurface metagenome]